jgi:hypothetical protein
MSYKLSESTRSGKKWMVKSPGGEAIHFGADGYKDFTLGATKEERLAYIARHEPRENWNNPSTAGFWSRWLLWQEPTISSAIRNIESKFGLTITRS